MSFDPPSPGSTPAPPPSGAPTRSPSPSASRWVRRPPILGAVALAVVALALVGAGWILGGDDSSDRVGFGEDDRLNAALFASDASYDAGVSTIFVAADPTDAVDLIAPAPWCEGASSTAPADAPESATVAVDPLGPCADVDTIASLPDADAVLDCRAEEAAVMTAAAVRFADTGRDLDLLESLVPIYLTELPRHWEVTPATDGRSAGIVPRAVGRCADLEPKSPPKSLVVVECGAEYAVVTSAVQSYQLEFGVTPASVAALAPAFLTESPTNWTLAPAGDPSGRAVVPAADGACVGFDD